MFKPRAGNHQKLLSNKPEILSYIRPAARKNRNPHSSLTCAVVAGLRGNTRSCSERETRPSTLLKSFRPQPPCPSHATTQCVASENGRSGPQAWPSLSQPPSGSIVRCRVSSTAARSSRPVELPVHRWMVERKPLSELDALCHFLRRTNSIWNGYGWISERSKDALLTLKGQVVRHTGG